VYSIDFSSFLIIIGAYLLLNLHTLSSIPFVYCNVYFLNSDHISCIYNNIRNKGTKDIDKTTEWTA